MNIIVLLAITSVTGLLLLIMGSIMLSGRGAFLIAGYNTMSKSEKEKYDAAALCKFIGKIILAMGVTTPLIAIGAIYNISWLIVFYTVITLGLSAFAVAYCNTGNRFKK